MLQRPGRTVAESVKLDKNQGKYLNTYVLFQVKFIAVTFLGNFEPTNFYLTFHCMRVFEIEFSPGFFKP